MHSNVEHRAKSCNAVVISGVSVGAPVDDDEIDISNGWSTSD